jgi:hypothetical protein
VHNCDIPLIGDDSDTRAALQVAPLICDTDLAVVDDIWEELRAALRHNLPIIEIGGMPAINYNFELNCLDPLLNSRGRQ